MSNTILDIDQKELYFKLVEIFNLESIVRYRYSGVYAIYKNTKCLYIGMSTNFASRIATHLRGKYRKATTIYFWNGSVNDWFLKL